ncbi:MAG TPA: RICIN domain-containing protein [Chthoniobacterales bacterium]|nr:RICIN domain-containing protein [Chthoniobacterales bacterium]
MTVLDSMSTPCSLVKVVQRIRNERKYLMTAVKTGKLQDPHSITGWNASFEILIALLLGKGTALLLGTETNPTQSVTIVNKLSGKVLEVEDSSTNWGARIQQVTRNGAPNQRWFVKPMKLIRHRTIPEVTGGQTRRYWSNFLRFPQAAHSVIAEHSGLCLDILNSTTDSGVAVQQPTGNGGQSHLWAFVPDNEGFNFIVNLQSGQVLDVADSSLKNYATVQQYPFNGGHSQRWQSFS